MAGTRSAPPGARYAPPGASAMVESLRGLGYSTATALADIIDNSIAAHATHVDLIFQWSQRDSTVVILDDGDGMNEQQLDAAMRLGARSPLDERARDDLGRFGMGLKTASFSQARRLTVASRKAGITNCLRWDLDLLASGGDGGGGWYLLEGPAPASESRLSELGSRASGTLVLWEMLDRIITAGFREQDYLDLMDRVEKHLAMVFHRFLEGPHPRIQLTINARPITPWDPFLASNPASWTSPIARIPTAYGLVEVQGHVLPHKDRLDGKTQERAAGPDGWTSQQGFYVYRNERLLLAGGWLGLGRGRPWTREEPHRLARIRLDIPNTADVSWKIDVRKSTARPPVGIREQLTRLAEDTRERARRVFAHRGQATRVAGDALVQAWRAEHFQGGIRYRIDTEHPAIKHVLEDGAMDQKTIKAMLRVIEETVPVQRIWLDTAESKETPRTGFAGEPVAEVMAVLSVVYKNLVTRKGMTCTAARERLLQTEPFNNHPDLVASLPDLPSGNR